MSRRLDFETRFARDVEREPSYTGRPRAVIPLSYGGALRTYFNGTTCAHSCIEVWRGIRRCVNCGAEGLK